MAIKFQPTSSFAKMIIVAELLLVSYLLYTLTLSVYKSYQIELHIKSYENEIASLEKENRIKNDEYEYSTSESYVEKFAKENLGLVNPGEEVIVIPKSDAGRTGMIGNLNVKDDNDENVKMLSNPEKWWIFFFDRSKQKT